MSVKESCECYHKFPSAFLNSFANKCWINNFHKKKFMIVTTGQNISTKFPKMGNIVDSDTTKTKTLPDYCKTITLNVIKKYSK